MRDKNKRPWDNNGGWRRMNRCRICDAMYNQDYLDRFLDEGYCPVCAGEISLCLQELEDFEEVGHEENFD